MIFLSFLFSLKTQILHYIRHIPQKIHFYSVCYHCWVRYNLFHGLSVYSTNIWFILAISKKNDTQWWLLCLHLSVIAMEFYKRYLSTKIQPYSPSNSASNDTQSDSIPSILISYTNKPPFECFYVID